MSDRIVVHGSVDGNLFVVMGVAQKALRRAGKGDEAKEMVARVVEQDSYEKALAVIVEYVEFEL